VSGFDLHRWFLRPHVRFALWRAIRHKGCC
jgi:hypothetical protein